MHLTERAGLIITVHNTTSMVLEGSGGCFSCQLVLFPPQACSHEVA